MECFNLFQEPLEPAGVETQFFEFGKGTGDVHLLIVSKLGTLYQIKDDGILEADQD